MSKLNPLSLEIVRLASHDVIATSGGTPAVQINYFTRGGELKQATGGNFSDGNFYWVDYANNQVTGTPRDSGEGRFTVPAGVYVWYHNGWTTDGEGWDEGKALNIAGYDDYYYSYVLEP